MTMTFKQPSQALYYSHTDFTLDKLFELFLSHAGKSEVSKKQTKVLKKLQLPDVNKIRYVSGIRGALQSVQFENVHNNWSYTSYSLNEEGSWSRCNPKSSLIWRNFSLFPGF